MNTSQLQCCIECSLSLKKYIAGVFAADELPSKLKYGSGFIANTDKHNKPGRHWCSFYFPKTGVVEYFDSYGKSIDHYNNEFIKYVSSFPTIAMNSNQLQSVNSNICGCIVYFSYCTE